MANCNDCKATQPATVPFAVHESALARAERHAKRAWATIIVLILLLVGSNGAWLFFEAQYDRTESFTQEVVQDAENGENHFIGGDVYGETNRENNDNS